MAEIICQQWFAGAGWVAPSGLADNAADKTIQ